MTWNSDHLQKVFLRAKQVKRKVRGRKFDLSILIKKKKMLGSLSMWTCTRLPSAKCCHLLRNTELQNLSSPHTPHPRKEKKKKSTASLSLNWLFISFHGTQRANPEATWATNAGSGGDHHGTCHSLLTTHKTHWLQLYEVKMPEKKENVKEVSAVISFQRGERGRKSCCIWIWRTKPA